MDPEPKMGKVLYQCPTTGKIVPTGMLMDRTVFESMGSTPGDTFGCTVCGIHHVGAPGEFIFEEDD